MRLDRRTPTAPWLRRRSGGSAAATCASPEPSPTSCIVSARQEPFCLAQMSRKKTGFPSADLREPVTMRDHAVDIDLHIGRRVAWSDAFQIGEEFLARKDLAVLVGEGELQREQPAGGGFVAGAQRVGQRLLRRTDQCSLRRRAALAFRRERQSAAPPPRRQATRHVRIDVQRPGQSLQLLPQRAQCRPPAFSFLRPNHSRAEKTATSRFTSPAKK